MAKNPKILSLCILFLLPLLFSPFSCKAYESIYQFHSDWTEIILDPDEVSIISQFIDRYSLHIVDVSNDKITYERIFADKIEYSVFDLSGLLFGFYFIDASQIDYFYEDWYISHPVNESNTNVIIHERIAENFTFHYNATFQSIKRIILGGEEGNLYEITGSLNQFVEYSYDENGVILSRIDITRIYSDQFVKYESNYQMLRTTKTIETTTSPYSFLACCVSLLSFLIYYRKRKR